jgi:cob(I)alamin adenosyltransferase
MGAKLYTKKGDRGRTSLFSGRQAAKFDPRVSAVGDLDELSAAIGFARVAYPAANELLRSAQRAIYAISAIVSAEGKRPDLLFDPSEVERIEAEIDKASEALPPLREFIFPGEGEASCRLHLARAVARRAERNLAALDAPAVPDSVLAYLNRLGDLLFALARQADHDAGLSETNLRE